MQSYTTKYKGFEIKLKGMYWHITSIVKKPFKSVGAAMNYIDCNLTLL